MKGVPLPRPAKADALLPARKCGRGEGEREERIQKKNTKFLNIRFPGFFLWF